MQPMITRPGFLLMRLMTLGVWLVLAGPAAARQPSVTAVEALRQKLATRLPDTTRLRLLTSLCYELHDEQPARALRYGEAAVTLARTLPAAEQGPGLLRSLLTLASCYANLSNGPEALTLLSEAQRLARAQNNADALARAYTAQGSIYHERGDSATAWQHYRRALRLTSQATVLARTRMKLLGNVGSLYSFRKQYQPAMHFDSLALAMARRSSDSTAEATYLSSLANYQLQTGNLPRVKRLLTQALAISRRQHALRNQADQLVMFAMYYIQNDETARADAAAREALRLARQSGYLERVLDAYSILSAEAAEHSDYRQAYEWNKRYVDLNDTLNNRETIQALATSQVSYETQERARRLRLLTAQHEEQVWHSRLLGGTTAI